jgi:hypothetical protein
MPGSPTKSTAQRRREAIELRRLGYSNREVGVMLGGITLRRVQQLCAGADLTPFTDDEHPKTAIARRLTASDPASPEEPGERRPRTRPQVRDAQQPDPQPLGRLACAPILLGGPGGWTAMDGGSGLPSYEAEASRRGMVKTSDIVLDFIPPPASARTKRLFFEDGSTRDVPL